MTARVDGPKFVAAFDVGGTHVTGALVNTGKWRVVHGSTTTLQLNSAGTADAILRTIASCCASVVDAAAGVRLDPSLGIAMPGPFDYLTGVGRFEGVAKFASLNGVDVATELEKRVRPNTLTFSFINDANAFTIGEWLAGAAVGLDRVVGITLGTGVGSAFLANGEIVDSGPTVPPRGYVYQLQVNGQPLEETVSRKALRSAYARAADTDSDPDVRAIASLARKGDPVASELMYSTYSCLGGVLAPWIGSFEAQVVVVGGSIAHAWDLVEPALTNGIGAFDVDLRQSKLFSEAALVGAAYAATRC